MPHLVVIPRRPQQLDLLAEHRPKPNHRAGSGVDFGVDEYALMDDELRDQVIDAFLAVPRPQRRRLLAALRQIAATPAIERLRVIDEIDQLASRSA